MGFLDKVKGMFSGKSDQASDAIDKAADMADDKTGNKYSGHIDTAADKAKEVAEGLDDQK